MAVPLIKPISDRAWQFEDSGVRCFLFAGQERALLVDSGKTIPNMRDYAAQRTDKPILLVNTHADMDHIASNDQFEYALMSPAEYPYYFKTQGRHGLVRPLWDGDRIDLGGQAFEVIETPGHTPGSISLLDKENRFLVGGDGIQNGSIYMYGPCRSLRAYLCSLYRLRDRMDEFDTVFPSHADFPQPASLILELIRGTEALLHGEIIGEDAVSFGTPIKKYQIGPAELLCDADQLL